MKLVKGNGRTLEVWDVTKLLMKLQAGMAPIKYHGWELLPDDQARELVKQVIKEGATVNAKL